MQKFNKISEEVGFFRFKKLNSQYLLTNDLGEYVFLAERDFDDFLSKGSKAGIKNIEELQRKGFLNPELSQDKTIKSYSSKNSFLKNGPSLHIVVLTLRCNHRCLYCHASAQDLSKVDLDMDEKTAKAVVDLIFDSPSNDITIEFQGGEPLCNFPVLQFIVEYAHEKNKKIGKNLLITVVSNLSLMDEDKLNWLFKRKVVFCTSLDGPKILHNKQRIFTGGDSYDNVSQWTRKIAKKYKTIGYKINALTTITKYSFSFWKEIVDEYVDLGFESIFLRFLNPFGLAQKAASFIAYEPEDFLAFYKKALDYIIDLNLQGKKIKEGYAVLILKKIFTDESINFLDLRSPCGAGIGQLAYNFNGDVFTCDEGRMLSRMGDNSFLLGNVLKNSYLEIVGHDVVKSVCIASTLDGLPKCCQCVYKPLCGVCPVYNYTEQGNIFAQIPNNGRCKLFSGIFDYLFEKLQDEKAYGVFQGWLVDSDKNTGDKKNHEKKISSN